MIAPKDIVIHPMGTLVNALGNAETEFAASVLVRYHQAKGLTDWTPVTRRDLGEFLMTDELVAEWARNPVWRPNPGELVRRGYVEGWETPDAPGKVTPKFLEHVARRGAWKEARP